ncbi:MAG: hypothetical protein ACM3UZ_09560 [Acidobacteriota bacterium]
MEKFVRLGLLIAVVNLILMPGCGQEALRKDAPDMWLLINKARAYPGASYELTLENQGQKQKWNMVAKGQRLRAQGPYQGRDAVAIYNSAMGTVDVLYNDDRNYCQYPYSPDTDWRYNPYMVLQYIDPNLCKVVREEKVDNVLCLVIEIEYPYCNVTIWQREDFGLPARMEISNSPNDQLYEYKNYGLSDYSEEYFVLFKHDRYEY